MLDRRIATKHFLEKLDEKLKVERQRKTRKQPMFTANYLCAIHIKINCYHSKWLPLYTQLFTTPTNGKYENMSFLQTKKPITLVFTYHLISSKSSYDRV